MHQYNAPHHPSLLLHNAHQQPHIVAQCWCQSALRLLQRELDMSLSELEGHNSAILAISKI